MQEMTKMSIDVKALNSHAKKLQSAAENLEYVKSVNYITTDMESFDKLKANQDKLYQLLQTYKEIVKADADNMKKYAENIQKVDLDAANAVYPNWDLR